MSASRGQTLLAEAESMLKKKPMFGKRAHREKTADKLVQCANAFRAERNFVTAGETYLRAAHLYHELDDVPSSTKSATDSAHMYAKDPTRHTETMSALHFAIDLHKSKQKIIEAATLLSELARVLVDEDNLDGAVRTLQEASDLYKESRADSKAATVLESVADLLSDKGEYIESARFFREVAMMRLAQPLTQRAAGGIFFKAVLIQLQTNDVVGAKAEMERFATTNPAFRNDLQFVFLVEIIGKIEGRDIEGYDDAVDLFRRRNPVDQWLSNRLIDLRKFADPEEDGAIL